MGSERQPRRPRVLLIDDGATYEALLKALTDVTLAQVDGKGRAHDGPAALAWLAFHRAEVDIVLLDVHFDVADDRLLTLDVAATPRKTRRFQGVAILREIRKTWPDLPVLLLTELQDLSLAEAAHDVSATPVTYFLGAGDTDALRIRIFAALAEAAQPLEDDGIFWGRDPTMRALRHRLAVLARGGLPVVLEGETGTGKSHLARLFVHKNSGRSGPFMALDLATVPQELIPAMLFGALRGSYTGSVVDRKGAFEAAHRGTLFLDEIQNTSADVQKQLLRVLQEGRVQPLGAVQEVTVDVKLVVAANVTLADAVVAGRFRHDLYMRLSPATRVVVPPLRARRTDFALLMRQLAATSATRAGVRDLANEVRKALNLPLLAPLRLIIGSDLRSKPEAGTLEFGLHDAAWRTIAAHSFPGNLREMAMLAENLVAFTLFSAAEALRSGIELSQTRLQIDSGLVAELLEKSIAAPADSHSGSSVDTVNQFAVTLAAGPTLSQVAVDLERQVMQALFAQCNGDFAAMAERLLGDPQRARAVRLRFNQLGLSARQLRTHA